MLWIPRNEPLKTLSERLDEHVSNRALSNVATMLLLNVSCPQAVRCLRIVERPQSGPFDAYLGEELLLESRIAAKCRGQFDKCHR